MPPQEEPTEHGENGPTAPAAGGVAVGVADGVADGAAGRAGADVPHQLEAVARMEAIAQDALNVAILDPTRSHLT